MTKEIRWGNVIKTDPSGREVLKGVYTLSETERFYCVMLYLTEKLSKECSFDRQ
jgi:hypothetical protein